LLCHFPKIPDSIGAQQTPLLHSRFQNQDYAAAATSRKGKNDELLQVFKGEGKRNCKAAGRREKERQHKIFTKLPMKQNLHGMALPLSIMPMCGQMKNPCN
jgi:hypothetical protein